VTWGATKEVSNCPSKGSRKRGGITGNRSVLRVSTMGEGKKRLKEEKKGEFKVPPPPPPPPPDWGFKKKD